MPDSIGGVTVGIYVGGSDGQVPLPDRATSFSRRHVPYSNVDVLDLGGLGAETWRGTLRVDTANDAAFRATLGVRTSVVLGGVTYANSVMVGYTGRKQTPGAEYFFYDAELVLGS